MSTVQETKPKPMTYEALASSIFNIENLFKAGATGVVLYLVVVVNPQQQADFRADMKDARQDYKTEIKSMREADEKRYESLGNSFSTAIEKLADKIESK